MKKINFLIGFNPQGFPVRLSGGSTVIKKLADTIGKLGYPVYVLNKQYITDNTIFLEDVNSLDKENTVVIYSEGMVGNPYNFKNVARWILYHTKEHIEKTWSETDEYFYFTKYFETQKKQNEKRILECYDLHLDILHDKKLSRKGYCHVNKHKRKNLSEDIIRKFNSENLMDGFSKNGLEWICNKFNEKEYFITNDDSTFFSVMAALCGCVSIIIYEGEKNQNLKKMLESRNYGIAYGFEEIEESKKTLPLLRPYLETLEERSLDSIKKFIYFFESRMS